MVSNSNEGPDFVGDEKGPVWSAHDKSSEKKVRVEDLLYIVQRELGKRGMSFYARSPGVFPDYDHLRIISDKYISGKWDVTAAFENVHGSVTTKKVHLIIDGQTAEVIEMTTDA